MKSYVATVLLFLDAESEAGAKDEVDALLDLAFDSGNESGAFTGSAVDSIVEGAPDGQCAIGLVLSAEQQSQINAIAGFNGFDAAAALMNYGTLEQQRDRLADLLEEILNDKYTDFRQSLAVKARALIAEAK